MWRVIAKPFAKKSTLHKHMQKKRGSVVHRLHRSSSTSSSSSSSSSSCSSSFSSSSSSCSSSSSSSYSSSCSQCGYFQLCCCRSISPFSDKKIEMQIMKGTNQRTLVLKQKMEMRISIICRLLVSPVTLLIPSVEITIFAHSQSI